MNEEDEENARSESNSGGSSPSDLKKLLQHHPLPNEGTRLAGRVISISRRLSRKRDFHFHETNGRIEEKVESEEAVEQEATLSKKRSFSDLKARDARARRRATIRLGNETDRKPNDGSASDSTANRYSLVEGKVEKVSERHSERQPSPLELEVLTNDYTRRHCSSLSARLYRDQEEPTNNGSSSQRNNVFKHFVCSNSSCENSPKAELQSVSPVSLRNSSRGSTYRRFGGAILQNLSSGSEAESNFEEKAGPTLFAPRRIDISPSNFPVNDPSIRNFNDEHSISSQAHVDSSRNEYHGNVASSVLRTDFGKNRLRQGCNDRLAFALPLSSPNKGPRDGSFCKILQSSRSDCGQSAKKETVDEEPMFFSARRKIRDYNDRRGHGSQPVASVLETLGIPPDVSKNLPNNSGGSSRERILNQNDQEIIAKRYLNHLSENQTSSTCESICSENADYARIFDRNATSTPKSMASPEAYGVRSFTMSQYVPGDKNLAFHSPNAQTFKEAISRCILNYEDNNETNVPRSSRSIVPRSLSNASEDQSAASSLREYFVNDLRAASSQNENFYSPRSAGNSPEGTHSLCSNRVKEFAMNVPTLVLNSQEASPSGKDCSGGRLDPNTLIMALSNASLKRRTAAAENTSSESCADSKTVSRLGSSENDLLTGQSRLATSRRSRIPVKIPSDRGKLSIRGNNESDESDKRMIAPVDYAGPSFRSNSSSPEGFQFDREDTTESSANGGSRSVENESEDTRFAEILIESSMKTDLGNVEKSGVVLTGARSRNRLSPRVETSDDRRSESTGKEENPNCDGSGVDTLRVSTFADNSRKSEEKEEQSTRKQDISSANESDSFSPGRDVEQLEESREPSFFLNVADFPLENYQSTYEGGFSPRMADERTTNLFEKQTGNGGCREILSEDSERSKSSSTSPEGEEPMKPRENRDKLRFSIERLAADQFRRCLNLEQAKTIQSDTATFFPEKTLCEVGQFTVAGSSSTSRLRHDRSRDSPRFKKRSQDRFPFTISEKTSIASMKFKVPGRLADLDEDEEDRGYKLDTHPSITRLAGSEFEDSPADIVSYVARTELSDRCAKSSGMRGLVKKFSAKWRKSRRRESTNAADVIYKNRDYREECESSNCSELSSLREFKIYESTEEKLCEPEPNPDSPDEKSSVVCDRASSDGESKNRNTPSSAENPCRRYDRDDLWVQALKDLDRERGKTKNAEADEDKLQDRYSVFFVKSARGTPEQSAKAPALVDENRKQDSVSTERRKNRVKFRGSLTVTPESTEDVLLEELARHENFERVRRDRKNAQSECFCLRFYRMIVSISLGSISKCRSRIDDDSSSVKRKKSRASLRKKKG
ncbi:hypothetical protein WN51_10226 [Melipona quadrifasciata]|uniref:Uncharacterized protein n=1 Tax=Melipona quadrifasciata TaxID=166423 RepID=A0A0M9A5X9_9HYME|nr:hypothetical protein WN51_10226 [Melipona quadrifasciata]